jgi:spectinomycin phosphotransferase
LRKLDVTCKLKPKIRQNKMVETLIKTLQQKYLIKTNTISKQKGGWASLAYKIEDENEHFYFLKVYEKSRKSTSYLTEHIDLYLPIVDWLDNQTLLKGKIIRLIKTQSDDFRCEDENYIYVLFDYIKGETVGEKNLTKEQITQLAEIVSQLHHLKKTPFDLSQISETFDLSFISKLNNWIDKNLDQLKTEIKTVLQPNLSIIKNQINEWYNLSNALKEKDLKYCLCHTDIHHWNLITDKQKLYLLDWEGIKFAPPEADIFSIYQQPYFDLFIKRYYELNPDYQINETVLQYYLTSRKLQDIFEFIEQLQFDELNSEEYKINLNYLKKEVDNIISKPKNTASR